MPSASPADTADVIIIGGGIIGTTSAYDLARRGVRVLLLEHGEVGTRQSGKNWGFIRQQGRNPEELPLMIDANRRWSQAEDELDASIGWVQGGNLAFADTENDANAYVKWVALGQGMGIDTRLADEATVKEVLPGWHLPYLNAMYAPSDGHANPHEATLAYATAAMRLGAIVKTHTSVRGLVTSGNRVTGVRTDDAQYSSDTVICAAGAASRRLLATVGVRLAQGTVSGTVALTQPLPPITASSIWASGLSFRQRTDGRVVLATGGGGEVHVTVDMIRQLPLFLPAYRHNHKRLKPRLSRRIVTDLVASRETTPPSTPSPNRGRLRRGLEQLQRALPDLGPVRLERTWAEYIDSTPDGLAVIDHAQSVDGLIVATGFSGHGFGIAPAVGAAISALATGTEPHVDLRPFRLARLSERTFEAPDAIL